MQEKLKNKQFSIFLFLTKTDWVTRNCPPGSYMPSKNPDELTNKVVLEVLSLTIMILYNLFFFQNYQLKVS